MKTDKRLLVKPKYKIGDIIVYKEYQHFRQSGKIDKSNFYLRQSAIIDATGYIEIEDKSDKVGWFYGTEKIRSEEDDGLEERDILYKLN